MVGLFCMYRYQFVLNKQKNIRILSKSTNLAEMHRMHTHVKYIQLPFVLFLSLNQAILVENT